MLRPHGAVHRELVAVGLATERSDDPVELVVGQAEGAVQGLFHDRHVPLDPRCQGLGQQGREQRLAAGGTDVRVNGVLRMRHQADDVPAAFRTPAMPFALPLGLWASSIVPSGAQ